MIHKENEVRIPYSGVVLNGNLNVPLGAQGLVLFAHGSGSGRFSPRNQYVAKEFNKSKIGTLLFDLLTRNEEEEDSNCGQGKAGDRFHDDLLLLLTESMVCLPAFFLWRERQKLQ